MTSHGLAYGAVGKHYRDRMDGPRVSAQMTAGILGIDRTFKVEGQLDLRPKNVARMVTETLQRFCWSADDEVKARHVPYVKGLEQARAEVVPYVVAMARKAWADVERVDGRLGFQQDYYLKMFVMQRPRLRAYNYLLVDEAQDLNQVTAQLVDLQVQAGMQVVAVGDGAQSIYQWRGAIDAMDRFHAQRESSLTKSFRFGQEIADEANKWLEMLGERDLVVGYEHKTSRVSDSEAAAPDAILCRTNAGVIQHALDLDQAGVRFGLAGGEKQVKTIKAWADAAEQLKNGQGCQHQDLYLFRTWEEVQTYVNEEGSDIAVMVRLIDRYGVDSLRRVAARAVDESQCDVVLSTAHGAKGREWGSVQISDDFLGDDGVIPSPGEIRLAYVAVTRAQAGLHRGSLGAADMLLELHRQEVERINRSINMDVFA
jgi:superfamily I DNA/RNA helicase